MTSVESLILGLIQGVTEFLPISSSGHLVLGERLLGTEPGDITFEVLVHFATLLAVFVFFRRQLLELATAPFNYLAGRRDSGVLANLRLDGVIIIGTIPAVVVGLLLKSSIESAFASVSLVSIMLLVTTAILMVSRLARPAGRPISIAVGLIIGIAQAIAILPGVSRSGSTITAGMFAGLDRERAFDFSFLLSVPAIIGATILTVKDALDTGSLVFGSAYLIGMIAAFVSGYAALIVLRRLVIGGGFWMFGFYTLLAGLVGLIFLS